MTFPAIPQSLRPILAELEAFGQANDATQPDRSQKMLNLDREAAELLHFLVLSGNRKRVLEIGTSNGYSTLWLAAALQANHGHRLVSVEQDRNKVISARANLRHAGLEDMVSLFEAAANDAARTLEGPFDMVFFDADRVNAPQQLALLLPKLKHDVLLVADNALSHADELAAYVEAVNALPGFTSFTAPLGKGLHLAHRR